MLDFHKDDSFNLPDSFRFPFKKDCISSINLRIIRSTDNSFLYYAMVSYRNRLTTGRQEINGANFPDLIKKVDAFIEGMK